NAQEKAHELADAIDDFYRKRAEQDKLEQDQRDIIDELWVDDIKLLRAMLQQGEFSGDIPLPGNLNVFLILEAARRMGIEFEACGDMATRVRVHKQIMDYERAENERKIRAEAEAWAKELAEDIIKEKEEEKAKAEAEDDKEGAEEQPET